MHFFPTMVGYYRHMTLLFKQFTLQRFLLSAACCQFHDLRPALHQGVIGECLGGALFPLAQCVKAVGKLAGGLRLRSQFGNQRCRCAFAACLEGADKLMNHFPGRDPHIFSGVPVGKRFLPASGRRR